MLAREQWPFSTCCFYLPFRLSFFYFLTCDIWAPTQELNGASQIWRLASVWVNPDFVHIWRRGPAYICLAMSFLPIGIGKSRRQLWSFVLFQFPKVFSRLGSHLKGACVPHSDWQSDWHTYTSAHTSVHTFSGCPIGVSSLLVSCSSLDPQGLLL